MRNKQLQKYQEQKINIKQTAWNSLSKESQNSYNSDFKLFFNFIKKSTKDITANDILEYIEYLRKNNHKNATINRKIASLSKLFKVMKIAGEIKENPVNVLKQFKNISFKVNKCIQVPLTIKDIKKVIKINKNTSTKDKKTIIFIRVLSSTGLRISECINIKNEDITRFNEEIYKIRIVGKGRKERNVYINYSLLKDIKKIFPEKYIYLFYTKRGRRYNRSNLWKDIRDIFQRKINKYCRPHLLRHFYATYMISTMKKDIKAVSLSLGHSTPAITMEVYVNTELSANESIIKI